MSKYLVILEAPSKATTVAKYLGKDYTVRATLGHVIDLPQKKIGVDLKKNFKPTYECLPQKQSVLDEIVRLAQKAEIVYLMTDLDREGTAIAWHVANHLPKGTVIKRAVTNSITKPAVLKAIEEAGEIDLKEVESYETRRILDRLVGWKCSFPTKQATGGQSAGRVQSAALRILAEREKEITAFVPVEFWPIEADLTPPSKGKVTARVTDPDKMEITRGFEAQKCVERIRSQKATVTKVDTKQEAVRPYAPFVTLTLVQAASSVLHWDQKKTMDVAQKLYMAGAITYHRTDAPYIEPNTLHAMRGFITSTFGDIYLPEKPNYFSSSKSAQQAHEAIRPTTVDVSHYGSGDESKLYQLVWKRAVASQMSNAVYDRTAVVFQTGDIKLAVNGSRRMFDGWRRVWDYSDEQDRILPEMKEGDLCDVVDVRTEQKFTEPPSRFSDASLTKKLESVGIGRPSTWASIIPTLNARKYVDGKRPCKVTDLGIRVSDFLTKSGFCFVEQNFTAEMEKKLDDISDDSLDKDKVLSEFWERLQKDLARAKGCTTTANKTEHKCPRCDGFLMQKFSKFGAFFTCENYANKEAKCDYKADVGKDGKPKEKEPKPAPVKSDKLCPKCQAALLVRQGKKGPFLGCERYSKGCKGLYSLDGLPIEIKKRKFFPRKKP